MRHCTKQRSLNKKGLIRLQECVEGGEWGDDWKKVFAQVDSRGQCIQWSHPSAKDQNEWEKSLWETPLGSVGVNGGTTVEDCRVKPFCLEIADGKMRCRIATISDVDWGEWKNSLIGTIKLAVKIKLAATILHFKLRESDAIDMDSRLPLSLDEIPYPCPSQIDLHTSPDDGEFKFDFGKYGEFHLNNLEIASLWRHKCRFFFRLRSTDNSSLLFEVELMQSDWDEFEKIIVNMCGKLNRCVRRDLWSESKKAFWTLFDLEQQKLILA
jgi:hypothetical protein